MKLTKRILAVLLALAVVLSLAACHKKDEIAVEYGDVQFTSGMYAMALLNADGEARTKVDEANTEGTPITDYTTQTVDGTDFSEWVKNKALEELSLQAAYRTLCAQNGLTPNEDEVAQLDSYVSYYYSYYKTMLEANGVGETSYREMMMGDLYNEAYFNFLYGEGGSKEVAADAIKEAFNTSYRTVVMLDAGLSGLTEEADITAAKAKIDDAKAKLDAGADVLTVYNEYNGLADDSAVTDVQNILALVSDGEVDSTYALDSFGVIKDLKDGQGYIWNDEANSRYTLVIVVDASSDDTFFDQVKGTVLRAMKREEFENEVNSFAASLTPTVHKKAVNAFKVKDIDYGTAQ